MTSSRPILILLASLVLPGGVVAQAAGSAARRPAGVRGGLFVGNGNASWLPKTALLPSAEELEARAKKLRSRMRNVDPFALPTFPQEEDVKPASAPLARPTARPTLNQALQTMKITGINTERREFLVGGRSVHEGDVMRLVYQNEVFLARVKEVGSTQIVFHDAERDETGVLVHQLLPRLQLRSSGNPDRTSRLEEKLTPQEAPARHSKP